MALCRPFRRNACACYMVGNTELAHFFNFARGGEFYYTFDQCILKQCFSNKGDVRHGLCCTWLSAAHSSATRVLATSWVMLGTHDLFCFARGGWVVSPLNLFLKSNCFLSRATSSMASAAARDCLLPDPAQHVCSPHYGRCWACKICFNLRCGIVWGAK